MHPVVYKQVAEFLEKLFKEEAPEKKSMHC